MAFAQRTILGVILLLAMTLPHTAFAAAQSVKIGNVEMRKVLSTYLQKQQQRFPQTELRLRDLQSISPFEVEAGRLQWQITPSSPRFLDSRRFNFILRSDGKVVKNMTLSVDLEALAAVAIAADDLPRGTILSPEDLTMVTMDLAKLRSPCLDEQDLIGKKLRRSIRMGAPFVRTSVETPPLVKRGDMVTITASIGTLTVTARGLAQENGAADDTIRVKNINSQKDIFCRVTAPSAVEVEL